MAQDKTTKAGIATLIVRTCLSRNAVCSTNKFLMQFNLTDVHLPDPLVKPRAIPASGLLQPIQNEFQSAASLLNTAISAASIKAQGAAGAAETAVSDITNITAIEAMIPRNCSLGTKQFCIGFEDKINCTDFPLNISNIVPKAVMKFIGDDIQSLQPLEGILAKVTLAKIQDSLILGLISSLISTFLIILIFTCLFFEFISFAARLLKLGACLVSVFCFALFLLAYLTLHHVQSKIQDFKSVMMVEEGPVSNLSIGAVICAGVMMLLTILTSILM